MKDAFLEAVSIVVDTVRRLGLDTAIERIDVEKISSLLDKWVHSLPREKQDVKMIIVTGTDTKSIPRKDIPRYYREDPEFRRVFTLMMYMYGTRKQAKTPFRVENLVTVKRLPTAGWKGKILLADTGGWGDVATDLGVPFVDELQEFLEKAGAPIIRLTDGQTVRPNWDRVLAENKDIALICHDGHGDYNLITGFKLDILAKVRKDGQREYDPALYVGKALSLLACRAGAFLLVCLIDDGAPAGDGYREIYVFYWGGTTPATEDEYTPAFLRTHWLAVRLMAMGYTYKEAFEVVNDVYEMEAEKFAARGEHDVAATLVYDARIHVLRGDGNYMLREGINRVTTWLEVKVTPEERREHDARIITWKVDGRVVTADGTVLRSVPIYVVIGPKSGMVVTNDKGEFHWECEIKYKPEDIKEKVTVRFFGVVDGNTVYTPYKWEKEIEVPLEGERTWYAIEKLDVKWDNALCLRAEVKGRLLSESGPIPNAQVLLEYAIDGWYYKLPLVVTDENGVISHIQYLFLNPLSFHTWLLWLLGGTLSLTLSYAGDWAHKPAKITVKKRIPPIWKVW